MPILPPTEAGSRRGRRVLAVGLGNLLMRDDGVGVHAIRELRRQAPRGVLAVEVGTAVLDAVHLLERAARVLAFDAMQAGGAPGTIYRFTAGDVEDRAGRGSLHEVNLISALDFARRRPREIVILGVEPERIEFGLELSPSVARALPRLLQEARRVLDEFRGQATKSPINFGVS